MSRRKEALIRVARNFVEVHDAWVDSQNRPNPDDLYFDAMEELFESFEAGDIPGDCRPLAAAVEAFKAAADEFEEREDEQQLYPGEAFWRGVELIKNAIDGPARRELPPLETIKELAALPYMQHAQIAKMYGFIDRKGNLLVRLVQMELDSPGSVIGPAGKGKGLIDGHDWTDPRLAEIDAQDGAAERNLQAIEEKGRNSRRDSAACKETDRELWEQQVGPAQAAKMLKRDEQSVRKQFADWTAAAEFNRKVWDLMDKGTHIDQIAKQLKAGKDKVEAAIKERPQGGDEAVHAA